MIAPPRLGLGSSLALVREPPVTAMDDEDDEMMEISREDFLQSLKPAPAPQPLPLLVGSQSNAQRKRPLQAPAVVVATQVVPASGLAAAVPPTPKRARSGDASTAPTASFASSAFIRQCQCGAAGGGRGGRAALRARRLVRRRLPRREAARGARYDTRKYAQFCARNFARNSLTHDAPPLPLQAPSA